jgi:hypothetical protein
MDGSGLPRDTSDVCLGARVLSLADRFDRLCTPADKEDPPMSPSNAIIHLFRNESRRFDPKIMQAFIKLMGIYPPSTILRLKDGSIAMVVSPGAAAHQPLIVVYDRKVLPQEAEIEVLGLPGGSPVVSVLNSVGLPVTIIEWLEKIELRLAASPVLALRKEITEQAPEPQAA